MDTKTMVVVQCQYCMDTGMVVGAIPPRLCTSCSAVSQAVALSSEHGRR